MSKSKRKRKINRPQNSQSSSKPGYPPAGFWRRMGAYFYDALLAAAIFMGAGAIGTGAAALALSFDWISLAEGQDLAGYLSENLVYQGWLVVCLCGFYLWFWTHGGQTLGMRAWRVKVIDKNGGAVTFTKACIRLITATFGVSNLVAPFDPNKQGLQDIMAGTQLVLTPMPGQPQK